MKSAITRGMKTPAPKKSREPSVVAKREAFADAIMEGASATQAARAAGYNPANAHQVMRSEDVQEALAKARNELENASTLKRIDVLNLFMEAINMARTMADPANMINGADKIAKMLGYYEPEKIKLEITDNHSALQSKIKQLSDADLYEMAYAQAKRVDGEVVQ